VNEQGYYWLGYEWSNLLLACPACNKKKSSKFPVEADNHVVDHPTVLITGEIDYARFCHTTGYFGREAPLIFNPELQNPALFFYFDYFCKINAHTETRITRATIDELELNREDLVAKRQEKVDEIIDRIQRQLVLKNGPIGLSDEQFQEQLDEIFKDMVARLHPEAEFTLLGRAMIERFDELILEDIERGFKRLVRRCFVNFIRRQIYNP
jgi:hypothetical protein